LTKSIVDQTVDSTIRIWSGRGGRASGQRTLSAPWAR